ncbi:MAG: hypothetical protein HKN48_10895, partial [Flavobacteriaceae bacterium]|nr:hypothetical protein [Flavobacteriaceae bacterium]
MRLRLTSLLIVLLFASCGGPKGVIIGTSKADSGLALRSIVSAHKAATPNFNTLASRVKVAYEDEKSKQSITVSL